MEGFHEVLGDNFAVHGNVSVDHLNVRLWALGNSNDVVEGGPVSSAGVNGLANWESLFELLDGGNSGDGSTDELFIVFVLESILDHLEILVGDLGSLVHLVDTDEKVGEVEGSNLGSLQETLDDLSDHLSINLSISWNWEVLDGLDLMFLLGGFLEDLTHLLTEGVVVSHLVSSGGLGTFEDDAESVDFEVSLENFEVFHWVGNHIHGVVETLVVEGLGVNGFTGWETLFEALNGTNNSNNGTNKVGVVLGIDGFLEGLEGDIEHEGSLILIFDANEEGLNVEVSSEGGEDSSEGLSDHILSLDLSELLTRSEDGLGGGLTNLVSEVGPLLGFVVSDRGLDLMEDLDTVDHEVLTNVIGEGGWALEDGGHLGEFLPVSLDVGAVGHTRLDLLDKISEILKTFDDILGILLLEVTNSGLNIGDNVLSILDALGDIIESFGVEGSLKETSNNVFDLFDINLGVFGGSSAEEESKSVFVHLKVGG